MLLYFYRRQYFQREKNSVFYPIMITKRVGMASAAAKGPMNCRNRWRLYVMTTPKWNRHIPSLSRKTSRNQKIGQIKYVPAKKMMESLFNLLGKSGSIRSVLLKETDKKKSTEILLCNTGRGEHGLQLPDDQSTDTDCQHDGSSKEVVFFSPWRLLLTHSLNVGLRYTWKNCPL